VFENTQQVKSNCQTFRASRKLVAAHPFGVDPKGATTAHTVLDVQTHCLLRNDAVIALPYYFTTFE